MVLVNRDADLIEGSRPELKFDGKLRQRQQLYRRLADTGAGRFSTIMVIWTKPAGFFGMADHPKVIEGSGMILSSPLPVTVALLAGPGVLYMNWMERLHRFALEALPDVLLAWLFGMLGDGMWVWIVAFLAGHTLSAIFNGHPFAVLVHDAGVRGVCYYRDRDGSLAMWEDMQDGLHVTVQPIWWCAGVWQQSCAGCFAQLGSGCTLYPHARCLERLEDGAPGVYRSPARHLKGFSHGYLYVQRSTGDGCQNEYIG